MDTLISLFYFLRPILSFDTGHRVLGVDLADLIIILMFAILMFLSPLVGKFNQIKKLNTLDISILAFAIWSLCISILYIDKSNIADVGKFIIPMITYLVMRRYIRNKQQYYNVVFLIILGFSIPVILSIITILDGSGLESVRSQTGYSRYQGVYLNPHNFGHAMGVLLISILVFLNLSYTWKDEVTTIFKQKYKLSIVILVSLGATYCILHSHVRTVLLGLVVFLLVFAIKKGKKVFITFASITFLSFLITLPVLTVLFADVISAVSEENIEKAGSGRPVIWKHNIIEFSRMTFDRQIAGAGIGNRVSLSNSGHGYKDRIWNSHNDFLEVLMQTGIVGFILYIWILVNIFKEISKLDPKERVIFIPLIVAVIIMNLVSNSYVQRFSVGQIFFMLLAYVGSKASTWQKK